MQRTSTHDLVFHGVNALAATLTKIELKVGKHDSEVDLIVAEGLIDCLFGFVKAARDAQSANNNNGKVEALQDGVIVEESTPILQESGPLINRCISLISEASMFSNSTEADKLVYGTFSVILESSLLSSECWSTFKATGMAPWLLKKLLLQQPKESNRQVTAKTIKNICLPISGYGDVPFPTNKTH